VAALCDAPQHREGSPTHTNSLPLVKGGLASMGGQVLTVANMQLPTHWLMHSAWVLAEVFVLTGLAGLWVSKAVS
jgi:hypothetical protein